MRRYKKLLAGAVIAMAGAAVLPVWTHAAMAQAQPAPAQDAVPAPAPAPPAAAAPTPVSYTSPEGDFSIVFPGPPMVDGRAPESDTAPGFWTYHAEDGHAVYQVRVDIYPKAIRVPAPNPRTYEFILRAYATESSSQLTSTAPIQIGDHAGMEGIFTSASGATETRRVVMAGHRVYQVAYTQTDAAAPAGQGGSFLGSFVFVPRP